jgi:uncharacterized membrane protein YbhN (UPF0104 family)
VKRLTVRWLLAAAFLGIAIWLVARDPAPLHALVEVDPLVLVAMVALVIANQLLMSLRIGYAVEECSGVAISKRIWFRLTSVGQFLNLVVPQLGNVYRAVVLKRDHGVKYAHYAAGLFAFVWIDLMIGLVFAMAVLAIEDPAMRIGTLPAMAVLGLILAVVLVAPVLAKRVLSTQQSGKIAALRTRATALLDTATRVLHEGRYLSRAVILNVLLVATQVASLYLAFDAVGAQLGIAQLMLFQVLLRLSNQIVVTPGNLGLTELAYGVLASASGSTVQLGVAAAVLIRALGSVVVIALGLALGGVAHLTQRRELETEAATS